MAAVYSRDTLHSPLMAHLFVEAGEDVEGTDARAIIDTGADTSCILRDFANNFLCLKPIMNAPIRLLGATGKAERWSVPWYEVKFTVVRADGLECEQLSDTLLMPSLGDIPLRRFAGDAGNNGLRDQVKLLLGMDFLRKIYFGYCPPKPESVFWLSSVHFAPPHQEQAAG